MTNYPNISAIADFCSELREARLFQRISLDEVARSTRITPEYLHALEDGQWDSIPAAYVRGYLGAYAAAIGMNRDKVLRDYDRLVASRTASERASVDDAPPLLSRPETTDVTRQKVSATWFIALASRRRLFYAVGGLVLITPIILTKITRPQAADAFQTPFSDVAAEYSAQIHSPFTVISCDSPRVVRRGTTIAAKSLLVASQDYVRCRIGRDDGGQIEYRLRPYDTLQIEYIQSCEVLAMPAGRSKVINSGITVAPDTSKRNMDRYTVYADILYPFPNDESEKGE